LTSARTERVQVAEGQSMRVDRFVAECWKILSRSQIKARQAVISVNGKEAKPSRLVIPGDRVEVSWSEAVNPELKPENIPLNILFENDRVLVVNKAQGMVCHPANGNWTGTLVNAVLGYWREVKPADFAPTEGNNAENLRPGIVHRLDKDTSGVIILAKDPEALEALSLQFRERIARKRYVAILRGVPKALEGSIDTLLARDPRDRKRFAVSQSGGKRALTLYRVLSQKGGYSLVSLGLRTGRTHQLRVHMRFLGCPILGDPIYSKPDARYPQAGLLLHAHTLKITLPGESAPRVFRAPLPGYFKQMIAQLGLMPKKPQ
jgi:23S rRNA pseudouridine1911/1915/1917 synthase